MVLTDKQTNKQINATENITFSTKEVNYLICIADLVTKTWKFSVSKKDDSPVVKAIVESSQNGAKSQRCKQPWCQYIKRLLLFLLPSFAIGTK